MTTNRFLQALTLLSLSTLLAGATACSNGHSPTEPESFDAPVAAKSLAVADDKRHGADDPAGDDRGGRQGHGADDPAGDDRGGRRGRGNGGNNNGGNNGNNNGGNQQRLPRAGSEREGTVASVDAGAGILTLAGGQRIVVNGQTQWIARGDLFSLQQVAAAVNANRPTRAEARGTLRADGALVAQTIKAEVDN